MSVAQSMSFYSGSIPSRQATHNFHYTEKLDSNQNGASSLSQSNPTANMMTGAGLQRNFRLKGYTSQNMVSPRQPLTLEDHGYQHTSNEPQVVNYYGKPSIFDPAKPRIDDSPKGMMYGASEYDRGHPHPPPPPQREHFSDRAREQEMSKIRRQRQEMDDDIRMLKERQIRERMEREDDKRKTMEMMNKSYPWDRQNQGHGAPKGSGNNRRRKFLETDLSPRNQPGYRDTYQNLDYNVSKKRENDLFLDVLGGADGKQIRKNGSPKLSDSRFERQQNDFRPATPGRQRGSENDNGLDQRELFEQKKRIDHLRSQIDEIKSNSPLFNKQDGGYGRPPQRDSYSPQRQDNMGPARSLNLDNTRGGAGAPVMDGRGKAVTRRPITLMRNDFGDAKIREEVPGQTSSNFTNSALNALIEEENRPYNPWGGPGGGAPIRDREGNVRTQTFGNFEGRCTGSGEVRRHKRRQEVLYNELREVARQQQENKDQQTRYMKAPHGELADVMMAGRVGKPKRNEITGEMEQHHLPNSDVSLVKMNHQPKPVDQKKQYHTELLQAAEERQHLKQLEKLKEKQESNAHFTRMDGLWGNLGGGAPKDGVVRKKANLFNSIHYPDYSPDVGKSYSETDIALLQQQTGLGSFERSPNQAYHKLYLHNDGRRHESPFESPRYVKATVNSSHKNMFDAPDDPRKLTLTKAASGPDVTPFATNGVY